MYGSEGGATLLMLHGGGQSRSSWRIAAELVGNAGYNVCALDLRGHGDSDWSVEGDYQIERFVEDAVSVIDVLGAPAILIGASFGGHVSLAAAARYPSLVRALVLCDVTPWIEGAASQQMRAVMQGASAGFASAEEAAQYLAGTGAREPFRNTEGLRRGMRLAADGRLYWRWDPRFFVSQEEQSAQLAPLLTAAAEALTIPTLLIRAGSSEIVTRAQAARFVELVPHATLAEIDGAQHTLRSADNPAYARVILDFLAEQEC